MLGYEVTRWHPVLSGAGRDVDAVLDRFMGRGELNGGWTPPMDAYTRDGNYVFRVDLPGVDPKDLDIQVEGRLLTIKGERKSEEKGHYHRETVHGKFERGGEVAQRHRHRQDRGPAQERRHRGFGAASRQGGGTQGPGSSGSRRREDHRVQRRINGRLAQPIWCRCGKGVSPKERPLFLCHTSTMGCPIIQRLKTV